MMAKYTKRAFNDIFNYLRDDGDFLRFISRILGQKKP